MFLHKKQGNKTEPVILHFVTWYPSSTTDVNGIFTRRHIELLASDKSVKHIVVQKAAFKFSITHHIQSLLGNFKTKKVGLFGVVQLPVESALYNKLLWRFKNALELFQLKQLIKRYRPALIHLHVAYGFAKEVVYIKQKWGIPFILSEHMAPFPFKWIQDLQTFVMLPVQEAAAVVAVSTAQAHQIKEFSGVQPLVIPNVVNEEEFFYAEQQHSDNYLHLVLVGIYDSRKGADYLLEVLPDFLKQQPNTKIHLVGEANPERMKVLQSIIQSRGIEQAVIFHGQLTPGDLCKLYHQCHFYVCASEWESFGLTMLEALFAGLPVLSTECGGVLEFINTGNGLLINNNRQKDTLLQGMLQMTAQLSSFNRKELSVAAGAQFSGNSIKSKYYSLYSKVVPTAFKQSAA